MDYPEPYEPPDLWAWATALLGVLPESPASADGGQVAGTLERLCRAMATELGFSGVSVELRSEPAGQAVAAASDDTVRRQASIEVDVGQGPASEAFAGGRPVLVTRLATQEHARWPGYAPLAVEAGIGAVFAFPLQLGAARFGTLTAFSSESRELDGLARAQCLTLAELVTGILLRSTEICDDDDDLEPSLMDAIDFRTEIYQAQGMVAVALGTSLVEALARLRGHAFATARELDAVAIDVVEGRLQLPDDRP